MIETENLPAVVRDAQSPTEGLNLDREIWLDLIARDVDEQPCKIDKFTRLIPEGECKAVASELERSLYSASSEQAVDFATLLVGSYTKKALNNSDIFAGAIASLFQDAPPDIGEAAVDHITKHLKWHPERADVYAVLTKMKAEREFALNQAKAQLAEHERRRNEEKQERETEEERQEGMNEAYAGLFRDAGMEVPEGDLSIKMFQQKLEDIEAEMKQGYVDAGLTAPTFGELTPAGLKAAIEDAATLEARKAETIKKFKQSGTGEQHEATA